jgi:hypothetical protein
MFKLAAFWVEFKTKIIIGGILLAVMGAAYWSWDSRGKEIKVLEKNAAVASVAIEAASATINTMEGSGEIKQEINTAVAVDAKKIEKKLEKVAKNTKEKVQSIEKSFEQLPPTPENTTARDNQTSAAMIDGLWDTYCAGMPGATSCQTPT